MNREDIYKAVDGERWYQDKKWGGKANDEKHSVGDYLLYIEKHLNKAKMEYASDNVEGAKHSLRKVITLGVACSEVHNLPLRDIDKEKKKTTKKLKEEDSWPTDIIKVEPLTINEGSGEKKNDDKQADNGGV